MKKMHLSGMCLLLTVIVLACQPKINITPTENQITFIGTVKTGAEIGETMSFCSEGLYLVAEEGYLVDQTTMLLLQTPNDSAQPFIGKTVEVLGKYPVAEVFCAALMCACEDFILVEKIHEVP